MSGASSRPNRYQEQVLAGVADIRGDLNRELPFSRTVIAYDIVTA